MPTVRHTTSLGVQAENASADPTLTHSGLQVMMDFWQYHVFAGNMFQVKAGTITTPLIGTTAITNSTAEFAVDAVANATILIASTNISLRLNTGTLTEIEGKSVAGASSVGAAFVCLPLKPNTIAGVAVRASTATARVGAAAGGVTVPAELATTTRRHWSYSQPIAAGAYQTWYDYVPKAVAVLSNVAVYYVQVAAATTGPSYYATIDFLDDPLSGLL